MCTPRPAALLAVVRDGGAQLFTLVAEGFRRGLIRQRSTRFITTLSGVIDGRALNGDLYFVAVWRAASKAITGAQLTAVTTFAALAELLEVSLPGDCKWPLRGVWVPARELRLLLPNIKADGPVEIERNPAGVKLSANLGFGGLAQRRAALERLGTGTLAGATTLIEQSVELTAAERSSASAPLRSPSKVDVEGVVCDPTKIIRWVLCGALRGVTVPQKGFEKRTTASLAWWTRLLAEAVTLARSDATSGLLTLVPHDAWLAGGEQAMGRHVAAAARVAAALVELARALPADLADALMRESPLDPLPKPAAAKPAAKPAAAPARARGGGKSARRGGA